MNIVEIITNKRLGRKLTEEEIEYWIKGVMNGSIKDYQSSALLMAICIQGLDKEETLFLTNAMAKSGDTINYTELLGEDCITVDKHSTGGVGDSVTFTLMPVLASCGLTCGKMSGRGLGYTGGTADKLESIPGYKVKLTFDEYISQLKSLGLALVWQIGNICPADKLLYALRDVTGTVESIPLIAASIMSKKLAGGSKNILIDLKCGKGAFMKNKEEAETLKRLLEEIGELSGRKVIVVITDMNEPLGDYIGNGLEIFGAIEVLKGKRNKLYDITKMLALKLLVNLGIEDAEYKIENVIKSGEALQKLRDVVANQGGDISFIDNPQKFLSSKYEKNVFSNTAGVVADIDAAIIAKIVRDLGGGRYVKEDIIDYNVGIKLLVRKGDMVSINTPIATMYYNKETDMRYSEELQKAFFVKKCK